MVESGLGQQQLPDGLVGEQLLANGDNSAFGDDQCCQQCDGELGADECDDQSQRFQHERVFSIWPDHELRRFDNAGKLRQRQFLDSHTVHK